MTRTLGCLILAGLQHPEPLRGPPTAGPTLAMTNLPLVLSASHDGSVKVWNASTGVMISLLERHSNRVMAACFSPCGSYIASASSDETVRLWRTSDGSCLATFTEHRSWVEYVAFSADGETLWSGAENGTVFMRQLHEIISVEAQQL